MSSFYKWRNSGPGWRTPRSKVRKLAACARLQPASGAPKYPRPGFWDKCACSKSPAEPAEGASGTPPATRGSARPSCLSGPRLPSMVAIPGFRRVLALPPRQRLEGGRLVGPRASSIRRHPGSGVPVRLRGVARCSERARGRGGAEFRAAGVPSPDSPPPPLPSPVRSHGSSLPHGRGPQQGPQGDQEREQAEAQPSPRGECRGRAVGEPLPGRGKAFWAEGTAGERPLGEASAAEQPRPGGLREPRGGAGEEASGGRSSACGRGLAGRPRHAG